MLAWSALPSLPAAASIATLLLLKACPGEGLPEVDDPEAEPVAEVTPEPTPTPIPGLDAAELAPWPADHPMQVGAEALRDALAAVEADRLDDALASLDRAGDFAPALTAWTRGRVLRGLDRHDEAVAAWETIPGTSRWWPEAALERAAHRLAQDDVAGVLEILGESGAPAASERTPTRHDQAVRAEILRSRALRARDAEGDCDAAYGACKRVWVSEPEDSEAWATADAGMRALEARVSDDLKPGLAEKVSRAGVLARTHANETIVALLNGEREALEGAEASVACEGQFQLGRAFHKQRQYSKSVPLIGWVVDHCDDPELGARAAYIHSQGLERSGRVTDAIAAWNLLADRYPEHRFADDGLYHAGQLHLRNGDGGSARQVFLSMPTRFPEGDMVDDALWGMAWAEIRDGKWADALPWLEQLTQGEVDTRARERVLRGRYWLARAQWTLDEKDAAQAGWTSLAKDAPVHWYGALALWRLHQADPAAAAEVAASVESLRSRLSQGPDELDRWVADPAFLDHPALQHGVELLRGGLGDEAAEEFKLALGDDVHDRWDTDTLLLASHLLLEAGDAYSGHNLLRLLFRRSWPALEPDQRVRLAHAYPRAYFAEIEEVTADYTWDPQLFQGLVREESAFSPGIKSWAGAMGLSQLMWPTAKATAKKMGITGLTRSKLSDPKLNLSIGSTYFQGLVKRWKGHLPLAIASYNAGPGAVNKWVRKRGHLDLDSWVETIPYDQTRHYVKRVATSWQVYNLLYGDGAPVIPLRVGPVADGIEGADPSVQAE